MRKQWTATALVVALGLAAPVLAQDDPMPPQNDPAQPMPPEPDSQTPDTKTTPPPAETPVPADKTSAADRERADQPTAELNAEEYVVQKGDTLSRLAERFLGSAGDWKQIADANGLQNPNMISVGQKLDIPKDGAAPASRSEDTETAPDQAQ